MQQVNSLADLKREKKRLRQRTSELEHELRRELKGLKEEIDQSHLFSKVVRNLISGKDDGLYLGTGILTDFLIKRVLFRRAGFFTRQAMSSLAQNLTREVLAKNKDVWLTWLKKKWLEIDFRKPLQHLFDGHPKRQAVRRREGGSKGHRASRR